MIERIKNGTKPTEILREIKAEHPEFRNFDLSYTFDECFGGLSLDAIQSIWHWTGDGRAAGFDDEQLDAILMEELFKRQQ